MYWRWADNWQQELVLVSATKDERESAERGISRLRQAGGHGETTGSRLHQAIETGCLPWEVVKSLSRWCHTEGKYEAGLGPAQEVSRALFNKHVLPRLAPADEAIARQRFAEFAERARILASETFVRQQSERPAAQERTESTSGQTKPTITYKRAPVSDYPSLVRTYSNRDLASPYRSTVPLLAYWATLEQRLPDFAAALGFELSVPEEFAFEYTVPVQGGKGNDSHTDLMLLLGSQAVAIEAKYTEPPYEVVRDWLGSSPSSNRELVLTGWLRLINRATGADIEIADVLDCTYQLIHRTASVCETSKQARAVVYQCFDPTEEQLDYYYRQLSSLRRLIDKPERLSFFFFGISLQKSSEYQRLQAAWNAGSRDLSIEVRQGLISQSLMDFGIPFIRRV